LDDVNTALTKARSAVHSFHVAPVEKEVDAGLVVTKAGMSRGVTAMREHHTRRVGLAISAGFILLLIAGILMKIRDAESRAAAVLENCRSFFDRNLKDIRPLPAGEELRLAATAVLLEATRSIPELDRRHLARLVRHSFGLLPRPADALVKLVEHVASEPVEHGPLSALIAQEYTPTQVQGVVEELWFLVYSDADLVAHEVALFEILPKLLHVDRDRVATARRRIGAPLAGNPKGDR